MKRLVFLSILLAFLFSTCKDKEEAVVVFPDSLQQQVNYLNQESEYCDICRVEVIRFEDKTYYSLYCDLWSCLYCHIYDEDGNEVAWDMDTFERFVENHQVIRTVPICQD